MFPLFVLYFSIIIKDQVQCGLRKVGRVQFYEDDLVNLYMVLFIKKVSADLAFKVCFGNLRNFSIQVYRCISFVVLYV